MKILQINNYHYMKGGSERVYFNTSKLLSDHGHDVASFSVNDTLCMESPYREYFAKDISFGKKNIFTNIMDSFRFIYSFDSKNKLDTLISNFKPDIIHLHIFYGRLTSSIIPPIKKHQIPVIMTLHEYKILCPVYSMLDPDLKICEKCCRGGYFNCIIKRCNKKKLSYSIIQALESYVRDLFFSYEKNIDFFIMPSKFILEKHIQYKKTLENKSMHLYNFVNLEDYHFSFLPGKYYLYLGRLSKEKGLLTLLKAFKEHKHLKLKIAGDGPLYNTLSNEIQVSGLDNVELLGHIDSKKLIPLIKNCSYLIIPSEWYENNPMSLIECMAHGKPAIGADIGGIPEIINDRENGFLFHSGDTESLSKVLNISFDMNDSQYKQMSHKARDLIETFFSSTYHYEKLIGLYKKLV